MWSILENRYEHGSWWTISFSLLCVHIRFASLYLFFILFTQDSEDGSSAKRHHHVLFSAGTGTGSKRSRFSGADGVLNQNGPGRARSKVGSKMVTDHATCLSLCSRSEVLPSLNSSNSSYLDLSGGAAHWKNVIYSLISYLLLNYMGLYDQKSHIIYGSNLLEKWIEFFVWTNQHSTYKVL